MLDLINIALLFIFGYFIYSIVYSWKNIKETIFFANFRMFPASWYILMRLFWIVFLLIKSLIFN